MPRFSKITKKQLAEIVDCYALVFPDWKIVDGNSLVRTCAPVLQQIGFETLGSGDCRPAMGIRALPYPSIRMLHQLLGAKHRQFNLREHPLYWKDVVTAMEQEFLPSVREPLDLQKVKKLCELTAQHKTNDYCMLAILNAYMGEKGMALSNCDQVNQLLEMNPEPPMEWELEHKTFCDKLRQAILDGNEKSFLDDLCLENQGKL